MKQHTFTSFSLDELSEEAKKKAIEARHTDVSASLDEFTNSDFMKTKDRIEEVFGIDIKDWRINAYAPSYFRFEFKDDRWDRDEAKMLPRYLEDLCLQSLDGATKTFWTPFKCIPGQKPQAKHRTSRVLPAYGNWEYSCCLTGTYSDNGVDDAVNARWEAVRKGWTCRDFVHDMLTQFFRFWQKDMEYNLSDDAVK